LQTLLARKVKHGLPNHWLGHFIATRLLWAAGYAQGLLAAIQEKKD